ncbi:MAG: hypothetical protein KDK34_04075 [Leptospiraceae bacterium]|nr:hypothetical protein [Leptospiraceae bacterium]MCB1319404.1 hypothetical protein [Leptospiraceae bacterium]
MELEGLEAPQWIEFAEYLRRACALFGGPGPVNCLDVLMKAYGLNEPEARLVLAQTGLAA